MSTESFELLTYAVSLVSSEADKASAESQPAAIIHARGVALGGARIEVYMRFYRPAVALPANSQVVQKGGSRMYMIGFRLDALDAAVDLLRNEKPIFFRFDDHSATGSIATTDEPVGEGEHDADFIPR